MHLGLKFTPKLASTSKKDSLSSQFVFTLLTLSHDFTFLPVCLGPPGPSTSFVPTSSSQISKTPALYPLLFSLQEDNLSTNILVTACVGI